METQLEASLPAVPVSVRDARETVGEIAAKAGASERAIEDVRLCVSEAVASVVRHAYREHGDLSIMVEREGEELTVVVRDDGVGLGRLPARGRPRLRPANHRRAHAALRHLEHAGHGHRGAHGLRAR